MKNKKIVLFAMSFVMLMVSAFYGHDQKAVAVDSEEQTDVLQEAKEKMNSIMDEGTFLIRAKKLSNTKVKLSWKKGDDNFSYKIYRRTKKVNGKKYGAEKCIATTTENTYTASGLSKSNQYQFYVTVFFTLQDSTEEKQKFLARSLPLTITTGVNHFLNIKQVIAKREKVEIPAGRTHKIRCGVKLQGNKETYKKPKLYYYSTNKTSVKVNAKGVLSAVSKGSAVIFVLAPNGIYDKVYVTVK